MTEQLNTTYNALHAVWMMARSKSNNAFFDDNMSLSEEWDAVADKAAKMMIVVSDHPCYMPF